VRQRFKPVAFIGGGRRVGSPDADVLVVACRMGGWSRTRLWLWHPNEARLTHLCKLSPPPTCAS